MPITQQMKIQSAHAAGKPSGSSPDSGWSLPARSPRSTTIRKLLTQIVKGISHGEKRVQNQGSQNHVL